MAVDPKKIKIELSRDSLLTDFGLQTLQERYLLPGETSPQEAFARAAAAFADDDAHAQRLYDYVSQLYFMFATPLLSNGGSERGLPISCFLNVAEDSRQGIFTHWEETGWLSSVGGGVGGYWGDLRSLDETTSKGSKSTGMIPFVAVVDRIILSVSQGGTRRGSYAAYVDISHPEIEEFITMRKPTGGDQNRKATNIHNAVNITDEFMEAVASDDDFHLRSPKDHSIRKTVKARDLWRLLIETRMQTGEPYMVFIDTINRALPEAQKKLGLKVKQSNLCVAPYTNILTKTGYQPIAALEDKEIEVWNGQEFSTVTVRKTSDYADLIRVWFEDGDYIDCTPDHKFYLANGNVVHALNLANGARLEPHQHGHHPFVRVKSVLDDAAALELGKVAYAAGWATFAGFEENNRLCVKVQPDAWPFQRDEAYLKALIAPSVNVLEDETGIVISYEPKTIPAGHVPFEWEPIYQSRWLRGALDAMGEWIEVDDEGEFLCVGSMDVDLIREMRLLALQLGIQPRIRLTDTMNAFMLDQEAVDALYEGGLGRGGVQDEIVVADVHPLPFKMATYCATEPKRGRLCFNGYVTGNCTEITLPTGRDKFDKMRTAVCCLSSVNAEKYDEWSRVPAFIPDLMRMLDNALQAFIDNAPPALSAAVYSASRERSVGLGLLGFQSYLQSKMIPMESEQARNINRMIFSYIKHEAEKASLELGLERGEAPDMAGTGQRFAHKLAVAPNASSSILCGGTSPSIEPHRANAYLHKTLSGSFPVKNPNLVRVLADLGMDKEPIWQSIIAHEGSVQHLDLPEHVKNVFKTATEIDQMAIVQLAADRAPLICQAQSVNLFFPHDADAKTITKAHFLAWKWGVKSLYYLRSTTPKRAENTNQKVARIQMKDFVVEDGSGKSDANSFAAVEFADKHIMNGNVSTEGPAGASEASSDTGCTDDGVCAIPQPPQDDECFACQG